MSLRKLSEQIQSIICSSNSNTYTKAVEELVYNSLDAKATSIAIRIHIEENKIQVVDNGCGIDKMDFKLLGQRYTTSKYVDLLTFKSAPNSYGFRGQSLASIIEVSEYVKITSRHQNDDTTWAKTYRNGKLIELFETTTRPSKGTTVEICGYLYNLNIQNKSINVIQEKSDIKTFLKQLSLVHINISLSLRDDSRNEIIFKMHKNKDMYPILKLLFDIDKMNVQELKVEKNEYKAFAFIEKSNNSKPYHWIFLNKRFLSNCRLHQLVKNNFSIYIPQGHKNKKIKLKNVEKIEDCNSIKEYIPFYVLFITCPYYDYDIIYKPKLIVEFKDWTPINKLIEKLIGFFSGGINVKEIINNVCEKSKQIEQTEIKDQVRDIMNKILGSKVGISQFQNGIKGKQIKRKRKTSTAYLGKHLINDKAENQLSLKKKKCNVASYEVEEVQMDPKICNINKSLKVSKPCLEDSIKIRPKHSKKANFEHIKCNVKKKTQKYKTIKENNKSNKEQGGSYKNKFNITIGDAQPLVDCEMEKAQSNKEIKHYSGSPENCNTISVYKRLEENLGHHRIPFSTEMNNDDIPKKGNSELNLFSSRDLVKTILGTQEVMQHHTPNACNVIPNYHRNVLTTQVYDDNILMTYQSHCYKNVDVENYLVKNKNVQANNWFKKYIKKCIKKWANIKHNKKTNKSNFISKLSRDNFVMPKTYKSPPHKDYKSKTITAFKHHKNNNNPTYSKITKYKDLNSTYSCTIENPRIVENCTNFQEKYVTISRSNKLESLNEICENYRFTYTITSSNLTVINENCESKKIGQKDNWKQTIQSNTNKKRNPRNVVFVSNSQNSTSQTGKLCVNGISNINKLDHSNYSRVTNLTDTNCLGMGLMNVENKGSFNNNNYCKENNQNKNFECVDSHHTIDDSSSYVIDPLNICQTILNDSVKINEAAETSCIVINSHSSNLRASNKNICEMSTTTHGNFSNKDASPILQNTCVTFSKRSETKTVCTDSDKHADNDNIILMSNEERDMIMQSYYFDAKQVPMNVQDEHVACADTFNLKNRFRFIPKGMSPIFEVCNSKIIYDNKNTKHSYFENELYNKFVIDVQTNTEIYEAKVQNPKDATAIEKVNSRLDKDNSSLTFDQKSLEEATVLAQVDNKYIATILTGHSDQVHYLVLFDQHAVHERIRLENNMSDYFNGSEWKSQKLDELAMKLPEDKIMYLHNYKDKFTRFGLYWTIHDRCEIRIHSIPAAILGQNPREVDKVMKAVKNLITEEIKNITSQKGCVSLYPKAIMDLVFSEACRYAIKFGDILSKRECVELIKSLSTCKTPFQCAHGRPVMAIMLDIPAESRKYQFKKISLWKFKEISCKGKIKVN